jgi:hypothetical protein
VELLAGGEDLKVEYQPIGKEHIEPAYRLVMTAYKEEKLAIPYLPDEAFFADYLPELLARLFDQGSGYAALSKKEVVGFLSGFERGELWGRNKGIYSPLYGHGASKEQRSEIYQGLYTKAAQMWVQKQHFTHALTFFAHDRQTIDTWFWLGFGLRCVDSIRQAAPIMVYNPDPAITIKKGELDDIPALRDIQT